VTKRKTHSRIGGDFEGFLRDEGRLEEATAVAIKRALAWEIQRAMDSAGVSQAEMARRMKTSRAVVRRLLDDSDPSVTLATICRAALALGKQVRLTLAAGTAHAGMPGMQRIPLKPVRLHKRGPRSPRTRRCASQWPRHALPVADDAMTETAKNLSAQALARRAAGAGGRSLAKYRVK